MNEFIRITSKDNSLIKLISSLQKNTKTRRENRQFVLEGLRLCRDAVLNNYEVKTLLVSDFAYDKYKEDILLIAEKSEGCFIVPDYLFNKLSDTVSPQGLLCVCSIPSFKDYEINDKGKYIALENISDPSNLGAVSRTAKALGINGIFISKDSCDPYSSKALRASMGALLRIPVIVCDDLIGTLISNNLTVFAAVVDKSANDVSKVDFNDGSVVVVGNEANGLTKETIEQCHKNITIHMSGKAESLNAAAAASIIMWEMCKN